jgi:hypothetical protein
VYDDHGNGTLVHSHQSYLEENVEEELSVASLGLQDGVPGMMSDFTSGWIGDPRMVGRPGPRRVRFFDLGLIVFRVTRSDFDCDHLAFTLPTLLAR